MLRMHAYIYASTLRNVCTSGGLQIQQNTLAVAHQAHQHPQATMIPSWNGRHWESPPLSDTSDAPSTLTIFRPPSPFSDGHSRMESMMEASASVLPRLPAPSAEPPMLPDAPPAAADISTSHLPALMDGSVGPTNDGAAAHNVHGVTTKPPENAPFTSARDKVLVARGKVAIDRKARVSFFFYYPHQRRGYNRAQTCLRRWICSSRCLTVILLISP